jgi:hypothetical protein
MIYETTNAFGFSKPFFYLKHIIILFLLHLFILDRIILNLSQETNKNQKQYNRFLLGYVMAKSKIYLAVFITLNI